MSVRTLIVWSTTTVQRDTSCSITMQEEIGANQNRGRWFVVKGTGRQCFSVSFSQTGGACACGNALCVRPCGRMAKSPRRKGPASRIHPNIPTFYPANVLLSPLECALTDNHRVLLSFSRNCPFATPLVSAVTEAAHVTPLKWAVTKKVEGHCFQFRFSSFQLRVHSHTSSFSGKYGRRIRPAANFSGRRGSAWRRL